LEDENETERPGDYGFSGDAGCDEALIPQTNVFKLTVSEMTGKRRTKKA